MFKFFLNYISLVKAYNPFIFRIIFYEIFFLTIIGIKYSKKLQGWNNTPSISAPYFFINIVNKFIINKKIINIIDIGSGTGKMLAFLSKKNKKINLLGIEANKEVYNLSLKLSKNHKP